MIANAEGIPISPFQIITPAPPGTQVGTFVAGGDINQVYNGPPPGSKDLRARYLMRRYTQEVVGTAAGGIALFSETIVGGTLRRYPTNGYVLTGAYTAYHGIGAPPEGPTGPCAPQAGGDGCQNSHGMVRYSVQSLLASLHLVDTPLSYAAPFGPAMDFSIAYNHREVRPVPAKQASATGFSNLGPQWTFNWLSYVTDTPGSNASATVFRLGGGSETFTGFNPASQTYAPARDSQATLEKLADGTYRRRDGAGWRWDFAHSDGAAAAPRRFHLTKIVDPQGNEVNLAYGANHRLDTITEGLPI